MVTPARDIATNPLLWLRCPLCRGELAGAGERYLCRRCDRAYPVVLGIPDLRVYPDPLIPLEDDYRKGERLQREAERLSFAELVAFYWTLPTYPPTPPDLSARFVRHVQTDERRIDSYARLLGEGEAFLDVGCGAGALVRAASARFRTAVGLDVGFRWLVVARRGLEEAGLPAHLVCGCADHLPFGAGRFDTVASVALLEHVPDAPAVLREFARVRRERAGGAGAAAGERPGGTAGRGPGATGVGRVVVWTSNRFSLAPEPHVRLWGVGFLPRRWMPAYVRWRRGLAYEGKHLLSRFELARAFRSAGLKPRFHLPPIAAADLEHAGAPARAAVRVYELLRKVPLLRSLIVPVFPALLASAGRPRLTERAA